MKARRSRSDKVEDKAKRVPSSLIVPDLRYKKNSTTSMGDRTIYCESIGSGSDTTLVFVNNFYIVAPMWRNYITQVSEERTCLIYDLENQGASSLTTEPTIDKHCETLGDLLDAQGVDSFVLVGTSTSSMICVRYALQHQSRVRGVILAGPSITPSNELVRRATERTLMTSLRLGGTEALWDHLYALAFSGQIMKELGAAGYLGLRSAFTAIHRRDPLLANMSAAHEDRCDFAELAGIDSPLALILGTSDSLWPPKQLTEIRPMLGKKPVFVEQLDGAGHLPYMEDPSGFQRAILTFLEKEGL
jgi:3-oxoadipate enol-lactonase